MKVGTWTIWSDVDLRRWMIGGYFNRRCGWFHVYVGPITIHVYADDAIPF
ncbi:hypothetical protein [Brevibacillus sp. H7]